jgi:tRNA pseudouridine55 synthase
MGRTADRKDLNGILVVNKPAGMTSHDVVNIARKKLQMRRIGHAGTLDPLATGVLVLLVGRGTKLSECFTGFDKGYRATMILGRRTTSADVDGQVIDEQGYEDVTRDGVCEIFHSFLGESLQTPPMVSAIRINGQRLYDLARKGITVERKPREIRIDAIALLRFDPPYVEFLLACSKGTYVRAFAEDVGARLGCGACICQIERTKVGPYTIAEAVSIDEISDDSVKDVSPDLFLKRPS